MTMKYTRDHSRWFIAIWNPEKQQPPQVRLLSKDDTVMWFGKTVSLGELRDRGYQVVKVTRPWRPVAAKHIVHAWYRRRPDGLTDSFVSKYPLDNSRPVYLCHKCWRQQGAWTPTSMSGVTKSEAARLGWKKEGELWLCPFCSGAVKAGKGGDIDDSP